MKSYLRILKYVRVYWPNAVLNIVFNLLTVIFSLVSLAMIIPFLRLIFRKEPIDAVKADFELSVNGVINWFNYNMKEIIEAHGKEEALIFLCIAVLVVFFFKNLFRFLATYFLAPVRNNVVRDIRNDLYQKVIALPIGYYSEERKGDIISRMTSDVQEIEWCIMSTMEAFFKEPINIIAYLIAMIYMSPQLTLFVLVLLPLTGLIIGKIGKSLKRQSVKGQNKLGVLLSIMDETLSGLRIIKAFTAEKLQLNKFVKENNEHAYLMTKMIRRRDLSSPLSEFLGIGVVVTVLWFGGRMVLAEEGNLGAETFIGFILIFSQLIAPAKAFSTAFYHIQKGIASAERIEKIMDAEITIKDAPNAISKDEFKENIEYRNINFNYGEKPVLKDINVIIKKGQTIALVGPSGAGKSTMVDLLPRFYDTIEGEIFVDGVNIKNYKLHELRKLIGVVSQEAILFNDTVFNNIAFGLENVTEGAVRHAAQVANAHEFIIHMDDGYNSVIGDRGMKLSGGQRQRLTIARAVLKNPPILILDEATSALDSESEKLVQDALNQLLKNRTSIVIAHRLATVQQADEILVMNEGKIVQRGTHLSLMAQEGMYKKLVDLQAL